MLTDLEQAKKTEQSNAKTYEDKLKVVLLMFVFVDISKVRSFSILMLINRHYCTHYFIRSTPPSRPNKMGLKCPSARPYVRTSVRSQKVTSISMKFGVYIEVYE